MGLRVTTTDDGDGSATVAVVGDVDLADAGELRDALAAAVAGHRRTVLDLTGTTIFSSAGVRVLYEFVGQEVEVLAEPDCVLRRTLAITRLDQVLPVHEPRS